MQKIIKLTEVGAAESKEIWVNVSHIIHIRHEEDASSSAKSIVLIDEIHQGFAVSVEESPQEIVKKLYESPKGSKGSKGSQEVKEVKQEAVKQEKEKNVKKDVKK